LGAVSEWCLQKEEERILNIIDLLDWKANVSPLIHPKGKSWEIRMTK
jgi:hypothetical protein